MSALVPLWVIDGPFVRLLILSFSFKGPSSMLGSGPTHSPRWILPVLTHPHLCWTLWLSVLRGVVMDSRVLKKACADAAWAS